MLSIRLVELIAVFLGSSPRRRVCVCVCSVCRGKRERERGREWSKPWPTFDDDDMSVGRVVMMAFVVVGRSLTNVGSASDRCSAEDDNHFTYSSHLMSR